MRRLNLVTKINCRSGLTDLIAPRQQEAPFEGPAKVSATSITAHVGRLRVVAAMKISTEGRAITR